MENLLQLITENPYRILGVYANASTKEIMANKSKALAFSKVGKEVAFPADLSCIMTPLTRTLECINDACIQVMSEDRIRYAQFWFVQMDETDSEALDQLSLGDMDSAMRIWGSHETMSSLQNQMLCYILQEDLSTAIATAETLYQQYGTTYFQQMDSLGILSLSGKDPSRLFLDNLSQAVDLTTLIEHCQTSSWQEWVKTKVVDSVTDELSKEVERCRNTSCDNAAASKKAGETLMNRSRQPLKTLQTVLDTQDQLYQTMADMVGLEILDCCINYFNTDNANDFDKASEIYGLMIYVKNTVVGVAATQRFNENFETIKFFTTHTKEEYQNAVSFLRRRKIRRILIWSIMIIFGVAMAIIDKNIEGFLMGITTSLPLCYIIYRLFRLFD